jgi:hypothetical protein
VQHAEKTVALTILTLIIVAASIFVQTGSLIFAPILNEIAFGLISIYFVFIAKQPIQIRGLFLLLGLISLALSNLVLEIILPIETLSEYYKSGIHDLLKLIFALFIIIWGSITIKKQNNKIAQFLNFTFILFYAYGMIWSDANAILIGYAMAAASGLVDKKMSPFNSLWILLFFLESTRLINYLLN